MFYLHKKQSLSGYFAGKPRVFRLHRLKAFLWAIVRTVLVVGICFIILYPVIIKLSSSMMSERDLYDTTVEFIPKHFTMDNFKLVWSVMDYPGSFLNTLSISAITSILQLISCTVVSYGFAKFKFPLKRAIFALVLLTMVIPPQILMVPLYLHFRFFDVLGLLSLFNGGTPLNLLDSFWSFALMSVTGVGLKNGLYIYILRQFFRGMPKELEEAAYVDGSGPFRTFLRIMMPSATPMMVTVFLFSFVWQWNDIFYSSLFLLKTKVLSVALSGLAQTVENLNVARSGFVELNPAYLSQLNSTGSILVIVPLIIVYLFSQRYFVESVERSGIIG